MAFPWVFLHAPAPRSYPASFPSYPLEPLLSVLHCAPLWLCAYSLDQRLLQTSFSEGQECLVFSSVRCLDGALSLLHCRRHLPLWTTPCRIHLVTVASSLTCAVVVTYLPSCQRQPMRPPDHTCAYHSRQSWSSSFHSVCNPCFGYISPFSLRASSFEDTIPFKLTIHHLVHRCVSPVTSMVGALHARHPLTYPALILKHQELLTSR